MGKHHVPEPPTAAHDCPGGCGARVGKALGGLYGLYCCQSCWELLPGAVRYRILNGDKPTREDAVREARKWFADNTVGGVPL